MKAYYQFNYVVFGHAGNSAAAFPMCRMGVDVWQYRTVFESYSIHNGPECFPAQHLTDIVDGLAKIHKLEICDAVLSGYIGSAEQGNDILAIVERVKVANPQALYFCDQ